MVSRKYTRDYRIEPCLDRNGHLRDRAVYCGTYYAFRADRDLVRRSMWVYMALAILVTATVILPMCFRCECMHRFYVIFPQIFLLLPVWFLWAGLRLFFVEEKTTREEKDKIANRIPVASLFLLILSVISLGGAVAFLILETPAVADWFAVICSLLRVVPAICCVLLRKRVQMYELPA